jgi:hypothetical protein
MEKFFFLSLLDKQPFKAPEEIMNDPNSDTSNSSAAIIKSASTPASLQAIVRFSNGSNMSLQHKVKTSTYLHNYFHLHNFFFSLFNIRF